MKRDSVAIFLLPLFPWLYSTHLRGRAPYSDVEEFSQMVLISLRIYSTPVWHQIVKKFSNFYWFCFQFKEAVDKIVDTVFYESNSIGPKIHWSKDALKVLEKSLGNFKLFFLGIFEKKNSKFWISPWNRSHMWKYCQGPRWVR